jgi:hypothetical protein
MNRARRIEPLERVLDGISPRGRLAAWPSTGLGHDGVDWAAANDRWY